MPKVPPGGRCESVEGFADGVGDGGGAGEASDTPDGSGVGEASDSADGTPSGRDGDDGVVGMGFLKKGSRALTLSRIDPLCFGIADGAGVEEPSDSADGTSGGRDGDDGVVGMGLLKKGSRALTLSRIDSLCFDIADEAIARRR